MERKWACLVNVIGASMEAEKDHPLRGPKIDFPARAAHAQRILKNERIAHARHMAPTAW